MTVSRTCKMAPRHFLLRVWSVRRNEPKFDNVYTPASAQADTWEVRARADSGLQSASLFYSEVNPLNLPQLDSVIHIAVDEELTTTDAVPSSTPTA